MFGFGKKATRGGRQLEEAKNWYADRYQWVSVQRNFLALVTVFALIGLGTTTFAVARISDSRTFEPYVIEVEKTTGITTLVDRQSVEKFSAQESIRRYYIWKYVRARESYDVNTYTHDYSQVVRLLSSYSVFNSFLSYIDTNNPRSPIHLGSKYRREVSLKSISFLDRSKKKVQVRLRIDETSTTSSGKSPARHVIVTMDIDFFDLELKSNERYINPLGFQVTSYRVDDDTA